MKMYSFGEILKDLRTSRKLSIDQLSKLINDKYQTKISKSMISAHVTSDNASRTKPRIRLTREEKAITALNACVIDIKF